MLLPFVDNKNPPENANAAGDRRWVSHSYEDEAITETLLRTLSCLGRYRGTNWLAGPVPGCREIRESARKVCARPHELGKHNERGRLDAFSALLLSAGDWKMYGDSMLRSSQSLRHCLSINRLQCQAIEL